MASIAYYRELLKNDLWGRLTQVADFLSPEDILATAEGYRWRDRIWNPVLTFWAFLIQVLNPGSPCREAVAMVAAEQAVSPADASLPTPVPIARPANVCRCPSLWRSYVKLLSSSGTRRKSSTSGTAAGCGWLMDRVARCRIRLNFNLRSASLTARRKVAGFRWPESWRCSAGPRERSWTWR